MQLTVSNFNLGNKYRKISYVAANLTSGFMESGNIWYRANRTIAQVDKYTTTIPVSSPTTDNFQIKGTEYYQSQYICYMQTDGYTAVLDSTGSVVIDATLAVSGVTSLHLAFTGY